MRRGGAPVRTNMASQGGSMPATSEQYRTGNTSTYSQRPNASQQKNGVIGLNKEQKRQSVDEVLDMFKKGNRDLRQAYGKIKEIEKEIPDIV